MRLLLFVFCFLYFAQCLLADDAATISDDEPSDPVQLTSTASDIDDDPFIGSPYVSASVMFVKPGYGLYTEAREMKLPAGKYSSITGVLFNNHDGTSLPRYTLDLIEGSLHYPGYYAYQMQNFSKIRLQNTIEPGQGGSVSYKFRPSIEFAHREFDISIVVHYHDENGAYYSHRLFNQTVELYEVEEGMDTEMLFLGVLVFAVVIAVLVALWHWCSSKVSRSTTHQQHSAKSSLDSGDEVAENEYAVLIAKRKTIVSDRGNVSRRQGRR